MASPSRTAAAPFQKALDDFKATAGLSQSELKIFQSTSLQDLNFQMSIIQNDQRKSKKMRYLKRLQPFLDTMEQYGRIVEVFLNVADVLAFIWGPMKFLLMVASNYTEAFNALISAYAEIGENIPQFAQYEHLFGSNVYMQTALGYIYEDLLQFHKEAVRYFKQRTWKQIFHATWCSFSKTVTHLAGDLRRHKSLVESQASLVQFEEIQNLRSQSQTHFEAQNLIELDRKRLSVQQWLSALDVQHRQEDASGSRYGNSGEWLIKDPRFLKWYDFDYCAEPLLWISGIPGAGKTVLASRIIEECRKIPQARIVFFYCRHTDIDRNPFVAVARAALSQLVASNDMILQLLYDHAASNGGSVLSSSISAKTLLETALKTCDKAQKTYIIIDGLDEYSRESRKEISAWLKEQVRTLSPADLGQIRCLFVSQDDGYARKDLSDCSSIKITPKETRSDMESFCTMWHNRIAKKFGPLDSNEHNIREIVTARAQGMFLYAKLVTWNLYEQPTKRDFLREMRPDRLPDGLEQAYDRIISRIIGPAVVPRSRSDNAKKLLGWLTCAKRILKWNEIQGAVSIDLDDGKMCSDLQFQEDCKDLCASLVERSSDGSVALVHSTAKRYLIAKGHVCVAEVEFDLAHLCSTYMSLEQFDVQANRDAVRQALYQGAYAFADYSSCFWAHHLISGLRRIDELTSRDLEELLEATGAFLDMQWASPKKKLVVSKTLQEDLSGLADHDMYEKICQAIASTKNQLLSTGKGPSDDEPLHLPKVMQVIRGELEALIASSDTPMEQKAKLEELYGTNVFKCHRMNCQFFSQGFAKQSQRDYHTSKHERSFTCKEEGCPQAVIGCVTAQDLQNHMVEYHGVAIDADMEFPAEEPEADTSVNKRKRGPAIFQCHKCPKKFTRAYNLNVHIRTHAAKQSFSCKICGKSFASSDDHRQHEANHESNSPSEHEATQVTDETRQSEVIHESRRPFVCWGYRKTGGSWGCGRRFIRAHGLGRHLRTETGRFCIKLLVEEEALDAAQKERGRQIEPQSSDQSIRIARPSASIDFPEALTKQYPALATIHWNEEQSGSEDEGQYL